MKLDLRTQRDSIDRVEKKVRSGKRGPGSEKITEKCSVTSKTRSGCGEIRNVYKILGEKLKY